MEYANVAERRDQPPGLAISTVIFALRPSERVRAPHALDPAGAPDPRTVQGPVGAARRPARRHSESLQDAASRNLRETTGLAPQLPRAALRFRRAAPLAHPARRLDRLLGAGPAHARPRSPTNRENVRWFRGRPARRAGLRPQRDRRLRALAAAQQDGLRLASRYHLLGEYFTLAQVREVYEAVLDRELDPANFRRQLKATPEIEETDEYLQGGKHRPPRLYRFTGRPGLDPDNRSTP